MFYSPQGWDPVLIVCQILSVQSMFYLSLGIVLHLMSLVFGYPMTLGQFFSSSEVGFVQTRRLATTLAFATAGVIGGFALVPIVERSKKCLDFVVTAFVLHLLGCIVVEGFPWSLSWWGVMLLTFVPMDLLGEWLCMRRELREIPRGVLAVEEPSDV